jgi:hypothetical protein
MHTRLFPSLLQAFSAESGPIRAGIYPSQYEVMSARLFTAIARRTWFDAELKCAYL